MNDNDYTTPTMDVDDELKSKGLSGEELIGGMDNDDWGYRATRASVGEHDDMAEDFSPEVTQELANEFGGYGDMAAADQSA